MGNLKQEDLQNDPRIKQARELMLEALAEHQSGLDGVRGADPERKIAYDDLLKKFGDMRGGQLFFPYLGSGMGRGPLVELGDGSVKYDFIAGIGVHFLGHSHPLLAEAGFNAALEDTVMQGNLQQNLEAPLFVETLLDEAGKNGSPLDKCFMSTSGAMANENALKIIFQKNQPRNRVLAFKGCFAGRSLALSALTDKAANRVGQPITMNVDYVPFYEHTDPAGSLERTMQELRDLINRYPDKFACMVFELVRGEGGFYPGTTEFFSAIMKELKANGIAVMIDEIQTFGRTPSLFAFQHFGLDEYVDVVTIGKLTQLCATLYRKDFQPAPGLLSQTFTAATSSIFAGQAILRYLLDGGFYGENGRINELHKICVECLEGINSRLPGSISGPFGLGAMLAFTVYEGDPDKTRALVKALFEAGVISFFAGKNPTRVRLLVPAGGVDEADIRAAFKIIEETIKNFKWN